MAPKSLMAPLSAVRRPIAVAIALLALGVMGCKAPATAALTSGTAAKSLHAKDDGSTITGDVRRHANFASRFLSDKRDLWVYMPPGYDASPNRRYPVLYMHDGNNLFDARTAFMGNEWHIDETCEQLIRSGQLPPLIVVGVSNTPARIDELTWVPGTVNGQTAGGKGSQYARMLVEEVKPFIDRTYRTLPDRAHTGVMGSSLGGLISMYLAKEDGDVFGKVGAMSPSVWWSNRAVLNEVAGVRKDLRFWLDMGTAEDDDDQQGSLQDVQNARDLEQDLVSQGYQVGLNLGYYEDEGAHHNETYWARRAPMALQFLFGNQQAR